MSEIRYNPLDGKPVRYLDAFPIPRIEMRQAVPSTLPYSDDELPGEITKGPYGMLKTERKGTVFTKIPASDGFDREVCDRLALLGDGTTFLLSGSGEALVDEQGGKSVLSAEIRYESDYYAVHTTPLLLDYARWEKGMDERVLACNGTAVALVPYWAASPYELLVLPTKRTFGALDQMKETETEDFIAMCGEAVSRFDALCGGKAMYFACIHQNHTDGHMVHMHFIPSVTNRVQFPDEYAILSMRSCVLRPESAAKALREGIYGQSH